MDGDPIAGATDERRAPDDPTVSVVLPTYNRASALPGAIRSVFEQSHQPLELIVVDGGSTDGTDEVLTAVDDERLHVRRREEPDGPGTARNEGVQLADGEYVAFVDADDRWRPRKLERQLTAMDRADAAVALTGLEKSAGEPRTRDGAAGDVHDDILHLDIPTYTSTLVAERSALIDVGGFDEDLSCFEDWELCLRLSRDYPFAFVDEPLVLKGTGKNISADPDRLVSAFRRLDRQYELPQTARAQFLTDVGMTHLEGGRLSKGRSYVARSLWLDPIQPKAAAALALSLPGSSDLFDGGMSRVYGIERFLRQVQAAGRS